MSKAPKARRAPTVPVPATTSSSSTAPKAPMAPAASAAVLSAIKQEELAKKPGASGLFAELKSLDLDKSSTKTHWVDLPDIHLPRARYKKKDDEDEDEKEDEKMEGRAAPSVSIVHVSDTHLQHRRYDERYIPPGDIIIHSGDYGHKRRSQSVSRSKKGELVFPEETRDFDGWLGQEEAGVCGGFKHRLFVAGNHEISFNGVASEDIRRYAITNAIYLQDEACELYGLKFYGSPWTSSRGMGFSAGSAALADRWQAIPDDTDVLITHMPPRGVFDLAWKHSYKFTEPCETCGKLHKRHKHWGSGSLLEEISERVKPTLHLFGHVRGFFFFFFLSLDLDCETFFVKFL